VFMAIGSQERAFWTDEEQGAVAGFCQVPLRISISSRYPR
jgi:hypothetical protein